MIGRTTHLEGSRGLNHARAPNDNDATELRIANGRCNRSTMTTNSYKRCCCPFPLGTVRRESNRKHQYNTSYDCTQTGKPNEQKAEPCQSSRLDTSSSSSSPPCSVRTRAKNTCLAKIRAGPYRKCETERKTTKEKEKTEQLRTASQPGRKAKPRKERYREVDVCENEGKQSSKNNMGN
jgi:hypothetical protein